MQFQSASQARAATEMHDRALDGTRKLVVRISDPSRKQNRTGALYDGRQVFVTNVPWRATEEEVTALFSKHGKVEKVRIPLKVDGTSKGMAYVVYTTKASSAYIPSPRNRLTGNRKKQRPPSPSTRRNSNREY